MLNLSARKTQVFIGGKDFSDCLISCLGSDNHLDQSGLISFSGTMVLGRAMSDAQVWNEAAQEWEYVYTYDESLDDRKNPTRFCRGVPVIINYSDTSLELQRHPRGALRILKSTYDDETKRLTLELSDLIGLLNFKEPTDPDKADNKSVEGKTAGQVSILLLAEAGITSVDSGALPTTRYNYPLNLSGSYLEAVGKILYANNCFGWIDRFEVFRVRQANIVGGGGGVAIVVGENELYYKRLDGAEAPVEKVIAAGDEILVTPTPATLSDYSEIIGTASSVSKDYEDFPIVIESVQKIEDWDAASKAKTVTTTTKRPFGLVVPETFWNKTPSGFVLSPLSGLITAEISIETSKFEGGKEGKLINKITEIYQPRATYLSEVKDARPDAIFFGIYSPVLVKKIIENFIYTDKNIIEKIISNTQEINIVILNGSDENWDAYAGLPPEVLVPSEKITQKWKQINRNTWEYSSSSQKALVKVNKDLVKYQEGSEVISNKLNLIPNPENNVRRSSNSGQEQPPATERRPPECTTESKQIKAEQMFSDGCANNLKPRERTFTVDMLAGKLQPILSSTEVSSIETDGGEAKEQLKAIALREGRLLRGRDKGQQVATNLQDCLFNYYPLYPVNCKEPDGTVHAYLADGCSWSLSASRALFSCDGVWVGTYTNNPEISEGVAPEGDLIKPYLEPIVVEFGLGIGFDATSYSYPLEKEPIIAEFGLGISFNPRLIHPIIAEFGLGIGFNPEAIPPIKESITAEFGLGMGFDYIKTYFSNANATPHGSFGMDQIIFDYEDDSSIDLGDIGFDFPFYGINYRTNIYIGSNSYVTFGYSSTNFASITRSFPGRGIFIYPGDRAWYACFVKAETTKFTIRFEGYTKNFDFDPLAWEVVLFVDGTIMVIPEACPVDTIKYFITSGDGIIYTDFLSSFTSGNSLVFTPDSGTYIMQEGSYLL
ncbi:hypothetical protein [Anabaena lutea]|uniref:Uncharacterized protein n=1 Tax=Anabaena lutea FACHB-196 TaxID=2692881 RepID=A0ABR8FIE4_9NOST|nr:hypothetical protein [Anabaena lutea]MBD2570012.1 hypothetical protein [Anabaena lutea FACHB-196]